jgi:hypothetical protein
MVAMTETRVLNSSLNTFNLDLTAVDTATGRRLTLPSGINTPADEFHPDVTADGRFAVFQRNVSGASPRIIMVNLDTGVQADLVSGIESTALSPTTAAITPNGNTVVVGRQVSSTASTGTSSKLTSVDVTSFPNGPFPKTEVTSRLTGVHSARTRNPSALNGGRYAWRTTLFDSSPSASVLTYSPGPGKFEVPDVTIDHPELQPGNVGYSVYEHTRQALYVRAPDGTISFLPPIVNSGSREQRPAFEAAGRYLAFIRITSDTPTVVVWDTTTQELVNPAVDVSPSNASTSSDILAFQEGNLSLFIPDPLITRFRCCDDNVRFSTAIPTITGLLVQRIRGSKRLLGKRVPKLKRVGRFPLGEFDKGKHKKAWNLEVQEGDKKRKLKPGCYLVTLRALTKKKRVRDLSKPYTLRVRKGEKALFRSGVKRTLCRRK